MTTVSIVVEWDNFKPSRAHRPRRMLQRLDSQAAAVDGDVELIVTFNSEEVEKRTVESFLDATGLHDRPGLEIRVEGREGIQYHQLKNAGGDIAKGDFIAFIDSDVVPDDGWLAGLLEPFGDPCVEVVAGATYTGPLDTVYNRSFASFWRFSPRPEDGPPTSATGFWSNNVAFRRETFAVHRWPIDRRIREENVDFCRSLVAAGIRMLYAPKARLEHSPPIGPGHLVRYGLSDGFNRAVRRVGTDPVRVVLAVPLSALTFVTDMVRYAIHISRRRRRVGLRAAELPAAIGLAACMALATSAGCILAPVTGELIPRRFAF